MNASVLSLIALSVAVGLTAYMLIDCIVGALLERRRSR